MRVDLAEGEAREVRLDAPVPPEPGERRATSAPHPPPRSAPSPVVRGLTWGSLALGAAGIGLGAYGGFRALGAKDDVDENCRPGCNRAGLDAQDEGRTWATVSTAAFVVAGAALTAGIGLLVFAGGKSAAPRARGAWRGLVVDF